MSKSNFHIAIDLGNSRAKAAIFEASSDTEIAYKVFALDKIEAGLLELFQHLKSTDTVRAGWISTAARSLDPADLDVWRYFLQPPDIQLIRPTDELLPIRILYATPKTLGADRMATIAAACNDFADSPVLVVDAGTAITYDVAVSSEYLGGGISPGLKMRFKALNAFTARLPLLEADPEAPLLGDSTENSMQSGVVRGTISEINEMISAYKKRFGEDMKIFLTGGDQLFFEKQLKSLNFARPHLVLEGIHFILKYRTSI